MRMLHDGEMVEVRQVDDALWVVRKAAPLRSIDVAEQNFAALEALVAGLPQRPNSVVFDQRAARGRNDAEFEARVVPVVQRFAARFARCAILVSTPAGRLHVQRLAREDRWEADVFDDQAKVTAWAARAVGPAGVAGATGG